MLHSAATFLAGSAITTNEVKTAIAALFVGTIVGITGMGGGALDDASPDLPRRGRRLRDGHRRPHLCRGLQVRRCITVHWREGSPNFELAGWLILGSVPFAFIGPHLVRWVAPNTDVDTTLKRFIGFALLLAASTYAARLFLQLKRVTAPGHRPVAEDPKIRPVPTVIVGAVGGLLVGITTVGSGSVIMIALLMLYPTLSAVRLVGTDLVQAVPLVLSAAISNIIPNGLDLSILIPLLIGSVPGCILGAKIAPRVPASCDPPRHRRRAHGVRAGLARQGRLGASRERSRRQHDTPGHDPGHRARHARGPALRLGRVAQEQRTADVRQADRRRDRGARWDTGGSQGRPCRAPGGPR